MDIPLIGQGNVDPNNKNYILILDKFFKGQGYCWCTECKKTSVGFCPASYFVTSGDAVAKSKKLLDDAYKLMGAARKLHHALLKARGGSEWLEVTTDLNGSVPVLSCKRKDRRPPSDKRYTKIQGTRRYRLQT